MEQPDLDWAQHTMSSTGEPQNFFEFRDNFAEFLFFITWVFVLRVNRLGEFMIKVTASNLISSASLSSHVFVVDRPCQPPPVKNMGPLKLQVQDKNST